MAPSPTVPEKPGDTSKVVFSKEAENLKNDLQDKALKQPKDQRKDQNKKSNQLEETIEKVPQPIDVGINLDVNG
jgi:hypothetical protein